MSEVRQMQSVVAKIARRYAARCWWAELEDLVQEGWIAALTAKRTWNPQGAPLMVYVSRAVALSLGDYLWRQSAPVSGRRGHRHKLRGMVRAPVERLATMEHHELDMEAEQWWAELRTYLEGVIKQHDETGAVDDVLLGGVPAAEATGGLTQTEVRRRSRAARKALRQDEWLREFIAQRAA